MDSVDLALPNPVLLRIVSCIVSNKMLITDRRETWGTRVARTARTARTRRRPEDFHQVSPCRILTTQDCTIVGVLHEHDRFHTITQPAWQQSFALIPPPRVSTTSPRDTAPHTSHLTELLNPTPSAPVIPRKQAGPVKNPLGVSAALVDQFVDQFSDKNLDSLTIKEVRTCVSS
jgi:hypothetical protein